MYDYVPTEATVSIRGATPRSIAASFSDPVCGDWFPAAAVTKSGLKQQKRILPHFHGKSEIQVSAKICS